MRTVPAFALSSLLIFIQIPQGFAAPPVAALPREVATYDELIRAIREARAVSQHRIEQAVDQEKVREAWETGKLIDEHILLHQEHAEYGKQVLERLAKDLQSSRTELSYMLQFARAYPVYPSNNQLSWCALSDSLGHQ